MRTVPLKLFALASSATGLLMCASPVSAQANDSKFRVIESYAKAFGVTSTEAERQLRLQREIGKLGARLKQDPNYAGHYIEHKPVYRVVAKFTGDAAAALAKYTADPLWVPQIAPVSYRELLQTQANVYALLKGLGIESASRENVETNQVEFFVLDPTAVQALIVAGTLKVPNYVTFGKAHDLDPEREATIEGGRPLTGGNCTSGFNIVHTTSKARFVTTAGHCRGAMTYNGVTLPAQGRRWETKYDYQWHTAPGFETLTYVIYEGLPNLLRIVSYAPKDYMQPGDYICKWGSATRYTCGSIMNLNYNALGSGGFVELNNVNGDNLSDGGDSGAPWYDAYWQEAWGIHSDSSNVDANDAFFMPVDSMAITGHEVLTTP